MTNKILSVPCDLLVDSSEGISMRCPCCKLIHKYRISDAKRIAINGHHNHYQDFCCPITMSVYMVAFQSAGVYGGSRYE